MNAIATPGPVAAIQRRRIRILVVDDSALVRRIVRESLAAYSDIEIIGTAGDPYEARDRILELEPDVVTLDIDMPKMDGITFLRLLMKHRPTPVIVMSSHTGTTSAKAIEAMEAGAVDFIGKPAGSYSAHEDGRTLAGKIRAAASARVRAISLPARPPAPVAPPAAAAPFRIGSRDLIVIGASTGGTEALRQIFEELPGGLPGICIVQHIPAKFSAALAQRLDSLSAVTVKEAAHGDRVEPGHAYLAPGGHHMTVRWSGTHHVIELNDGPAVHHQRPAVDVLFESVARTGSAAHSLAVILTGMGSDGAQSMLNLRKSRAATVAQDEHSCVIFGMPRMAIQAGAVEEILPLDRIAARIVRQWQSA